VVGYFIWSYLRLKTPLLFVLGFLILFTIGGLSGVVSKLWFRCAFHDTYYVLHIFIMFIYGSCFATFAAFYIGFVVLNLHFL
jgi:heme/copper-type cytochrome/quinol oxidase subunit 1